MEKIVSLKTKKFEKQYKDFYSRPENRNLQLRIWLHEDNKKVKIG